MPSVKMEEGSSAIEHDILVALRVENDDLRTRIGDLETRNAELEDIARALSNGSDDPVLEYLGRSSRRNDTADSLAAAGPSSSGGTQQGFGSGQVHEEIVASNPHIGVSCSSCETQSPAGVIYRCLQCTGECVLLDGFTETDHVYPEYDLCSACMATAEGRSKHTLLHTFWPIPTPFSGEGANPYTNAQTQRQQERENIDTRQALENEELCNNCWDKINGTRFKCMVCPDVDLCSSCVSSSADRVAHDLSHAFFPINSERDRASFEIARASRIEGPPLAVHDKSCDVCKAVIVGARHKCADCDNYDVCTGCLSSLVKRSVHVLGHVFLPIEGPQAGHMVSFEIARGQARASDVCGGCGNISGERRCAACWRSQEAGPSTPSRGGRRGTKRRRC